MNTRIAIDPTVAHGARIYDYLLDGEDNFPADREAAEQVASVLGGIENFRAHAHANRAFLGRMVTHLVQETGIRQFLDIGTGIPNADNVHAVAQELAPEARIMYVDNDPIVLAHAHSLLRSTAEGTTGYLYADLRDPEVILDQAAGTLDLDQPVAVMLVAVLHLISEDEDPLSLVSRLMAALPAGSVLALSHLTADIRPEESASGMQLLTKLTRDQFTPRSLDEVQRFFGELELIEPGLVQVDDWRPDIATTRKPAPGTTRSPYYGGAARKG